MKRLLKWLLTAAVVFGVLAALPAGIMRLQCVNEFTQTETTAESVLDRSVTDRLARIEGYRRDEERTYLTFPEWFIVYVSQDYGAFLDGNRPSGFPYFSSVWDFWSSYCGVTRITSERYPMNWAAHTVIYVIGISHSAEYLVKGLYENTIGRAFEWFSLGVRTPEERYARKVAADYGEFLNTTPWYEYPFADKLTGLWRETPLNGDGVLRKWERKIVLSLEYAFKAAYGWVIKTATGAAYVPAPTEILLVAGPADQSAIAVDPRVEIVEVLEGEHYLVRVPRYDAFSEIVHKWSRNGVPLVEIAGNDEILVTALMRDGVRFHAPGASDIFSMTVATRPGRSRRGYVVSVPELSGVLQAIGKTGGDFEHAYDY